MNQCIATDKLFLQQVKLTDVQYPNALPLISFFFNEVKLTDALRGVYSTE